MTTPTISVFDPAIRDNPYPTWRLLQSEMPVYKEPDFGTFVLTRFRDVYGVLRDHETFSSAQGIAPGIQNVSAGSSIMTTMITSDPPRHTRLRSLVNRAFTPRVLADLEPWLGTLVKQLVDDMGTKDVDVVDALTVPLPVTAIARLMGIPEADRERFKDWSDAVVGVTDTGISGSRREKVAEMMGYFARTIAERREEPRGDLVSTIVLAEVDGQRLTDLELLGFCLLLLIAGNETTTNLLGNLLNILSTRPDLWTKLREDRSLVGPAIEEALRLDSPIQCLWRMTTKDVEFHGVPIPKDSWVMVSYAAANRDPDEFPNPEEFRLDRQLSQHVAFGFGIHYCLGAPLARLETKVALNELLDRYETMSPGASGAERFPSSLLRGFGTLHLDFA